MNSTIKTDTATNIDSHYKSTLMSLEIGDTVITSVRGRFFLQEVSNVTRDLIVVNGIQYSRTWGTQVNGDHAISAPLEVIRSKTAIERFRLHVAQKQATLRK